MVRYSYLIKNFPPFVVLHTVKKGFSVVNETEVDVFMEFSCLFYDPMEVGNLISGSSAFSKSSLKRHQRKTALELFGSIVNNNTAMKLDRVYP